MKNSVKFLLATILFCVFNTSAQQKNTIMLDPHFSSEIKLYKDSRLLHIQKAVKNNLEDDEYIYFVVLKSKKEAFYVEVHNFISGYILSGWIKKSPHFGVYIKSYDKPVPITQKAQIGSKQIAKYYNDSKFITVIDIKDRWMRVLIKKKKLVINGWIDIDYTCSNPYNSCSY